MVNGFEGAAAAAGEVPDAFGRTPLFLAVAAEDEADVRALLAAGADPRRPGPDGRTPAWLAQRTALAGLVPGAAEHPVPAAERAARARADALIAAFSDPELGLCTEGLEVAFAGGGLGEDEAIRRIGAEASGVGGSCGSCEAYAAYEAAGDGAVGVVGLGAGGVLLAQPFGVAPEGDALYARLSRGTVLYRVFFNPKGGVFGDLWRDGTHAGHEEIGLLPFPEDPDDHWLYRFWQEPGPAFAPGANVLAYACARAGITAPAAGRRAVRGLVEGPRRIAVAG